MPILKNDPELLAAYRQGRRDALERVYRYYVRGVERYLRALARSAGKAELAQAGVISDLLQDVFVRAFSDSARRAYDGQREFGPYLATVARNCLIDAQRAHGRELLLGEPEIMLQIEASATHEDRWSDPKLMSVLTGYVAQLPPALRSLYETRYVQGRSQEEASAILGLSRRALRTGEKQLRVGLRKALVRAGISLRECRGLIEDSATRIGASPVMVRSRS
jgi:RNA polymerase sigma-70 factor (ECF subfamily)